ncbi:putative helicase domain protein [Botrytis fragariae]|uniref:Putative helicase domain protein n=1 Tax=Botrytis fragariae TaxID=1964551 RepID=A0A8H6EDI7_9HELO|nr:putative helicase domain protein [Botrytis fragariae]KAF5868367.1 putative helicase domain protein [Botrytis fragariae]
MGTVADYLHFQTTGVLIKWLKDEDELREGATPATKDFETTQLFKILTALTSEHKALVTGDTFSITHAMLGMNENREESGHFCYLHAIHRIITAYSYHFPNDTAFHLREIHSRENWHRGLVTSRAFWHCHKKIKTRQRSAKFTPAIKPLWINDEALNSSGAIDDTARYGLYKQREADEILELEDLNNGDEQNPLEERKEEDIAELEELHRPLNATGDIAKETVTRCKDAKKKTRKETPPEVMKAWIKTKPAPILPSVSSFLSTEILTFYSPCMMMIQAFRSISRIPF